MARLILSVAAADERRLSADATEHGHEVVGRLVGWRDVIECLPSLAPDAVIVSAERGSLHADLLAACDDRGIRLIAMVSTDRDRAFASALGLFETADADGGWPEIQQLLDGRVVVAPAAPARERSGSVLAVWGPSGAPGRTFLATNLAAELAAAGHRVVLVDADAYGGSIAPSLGLLDEAPGFAAACRLVGSGALNATELLRVTQRYTAPRAAFDVLTGLLGASRWPELTSERVAGALTVLRAAYEFVVIDTGFSLERDEGIAGDPFAPQRNAATFAALGAADRTVLVGLGDPVGLARLIRGHNELLDAAQPAVVDVIVNRVRQSAIGIDAHGQIRQALRRYAGLAEATLLPQDARAADASVLTARPLRECAPKSPLRAAIRDYVHERLVPVAEEQPRRRRSKRMARRD
ncbi:MAG TPA: regulator [Candidatus Lumbricidophila sp.]|nr:regulator [Candidatus Lumbricidophila sp.]